MAEISIEEVGKAVEDLRAEVEKKSYDPEKIERIHTFLDEAEEKNQKLVKAELEIKKNVSELKEIKEELEASSNKSDEVKKQLDDLEVKMAHAGNPETSDYREDEEYKALNNYARFGEFKISAEEKQLLRTDDNGAGGFLVASVLDNEIIKKITEFDPLRGISRIRVVDGKSLDMSTRETIPVAVYEGEAEANTDSESSYGRETVTPFRQTFSTSITRDMIQDSAFDMNTEVINDAIEAFAFGEGQGFVNGTGVKQPAGFAVNATIQAGARNSENASLLTSNSILLSQGDVKTGYDLTYVLNRRTLATIRTFRGDAASAGDGAGQYLWLPGLNGPASSTLGGLPYVLSNSMDDIAAGNYPVGVGDFRRGYTITDRTSMEVIRDELTLASTASIKFTFLRWNTGQVTLPEAITLIKIAA